MKIVIKIIDIAAIVLVVLMIFHVLLSAAFALLTVGFGTAEIRYFSDELQDTIATVLRFELSPNESFYAVYYTYSGGGSNARVIVQNVECVDDFISRNRSGLVEIERGSPGFWFPDTTYRAFRERGDIRSRIFFSHAENGLNAEFQLSHNLGNGLSRFHHIRHIFDDYWPNPWLSPLFLVPIAIHAALIIFVIVRATLNSKIIPPVKISECEQ